MSTRETRSSAKVISFETDFTASSRFTGASSSPQARKYMVRPFFPKSRSKRGIPSNTNCPSVSMPRQRSRSSVALPIPLIARTGSGSRNVRSVPGNTTVRPRGLSMSEAIFATVFEVPTPTEHVTPRASTRSRIRSATRTGCSRFVRVGVTSRNASSMLTCCTAGVSSARICITWELTSL